MPIPGLNRPAPFFQATAIVNKQTQDVSLKQYKDKYVILLFYPLDFTYVCPTEIIAFSDHTQDFKKLDTAVVGVSTDSHYCHLAWVNTPRSNGGLEGIQIPLLSDKSMKICKDYGVLDEATGFAYRGLFILDKQHNVRQVSVNDLPIGRSVDEVLRLVQAYQHVEATGESCPANWKPGDKGITE